MRVLLVEDDDPLADALCKGLREQHFDVRRAPTAAEARECILFASHDVIVLDVMLPGGSGFELCQLVRSRGITTPVLMLTARDAVADRVRGLELGADDYLTKPFAFPELVARIRALARRPAVLAPELVEIADLRIDLRRRAVTRAGHSITLTAKEFALLELFARRPGQVLDRTTIMAHVWDENHDPFSGMLEVLVRRLRAKIDDDFEPRLIQTIRGAGYRFGS